jgi:hypothetical protein
MLKILSISLIPLTIFCRLAQAQPYTSSEFYLGQYQNALRALDDPHAAQLRVSSIWGDLSDYSGRSFQIFPAQSFMAGMAMPQGIYLDIAIAADPSISVTRFFLAHEWGHMMHGDPLISLITSTYRIPYANNSGAEDRADDYAAHWFAYRGYDIRPALNFLCNAPDGGAQDTHSPGPARAEHLARVYGYATSYACADAQGTESSENLLLKELKLIVAGSRNRFTTMKKRYVGALKEYRLAVPITLDGRDSGCSVYEEEATCNIEVADNSWEADDASPAFEDLEADISKVVPDWSEGGKSAYARSNVVDAHRWWLHDDPNEGSVEIELFEWKNGTQGVTIKVSGPEDSESIP